MGKRTCVALTAQWIGEDATKAEHAYAVGDYDLLKACLESIQYYASDLGYRPDAKKERAYELSAQQ
jgi:hypothetical protein